MTPDASSSPIQGSAPSCNVSSSTAALHRPRLSTPPRLSFLSGNTCTGPASNAAASTSLSAGNSSDRRRSHIAEPSPSSHPNTNNMNNGNSENNGTSDSNSNSNDTTPRPQSPPRKTAFDHDDLSHPTHGGRDEDSTHDSTDHHYHQHSRFATFASSMFRGLGASGSSARPPAGGSPTSTPQDDELLSMDIEAAIYRDGDAFSPAAYKNLQQTASGLLGRFQAAYQQRTAECHELRAERGVHQDERDEADTRMQHLRMQLEDMARKAAEQEAMVLSLADELEREKRMRADERHKMLSISRLNAQAQAQAQAHAHVPPSESPTTAAMTTATTTTTSSSASVSVSEDLGAEEDQRRRQRRSAGSSSGCSSSSSTRNSGVPSGAERSDLVFDTDEESIVEGASLFSRSRSPTIATTLTDMGPPPPPHAPAHHSTPTPAESPSLPQLKMRPAVEAVAAPPRASPVRASPQPQQMGAFQKLFKGISGDPQQPQHQQQTQTVSSCRNCQGQEASVAWDTVNLLKDENKGLKIRVSDLEAAVEGALDAVIGIGI
ncbi:hypothetical protein GMORB2_6729 [Geosmithia morbida]|uniref:Uncharacterized protein n=1 Tax=Geosmithia morbida TaxID=1094350 RepID=A0A9P4YY79_9HYPO|nr:uncharacterized protein GMORB2_6729 [Geosmithia morbida]KAF4123179.1 hypothetical protein GMORB2_6729 [Geosmithia morbida]